MFSLSFLLSCYQIEVLVPSNGSSSADTGSSSVPTADDYSWSPDDTGTGSDADTDADSDVDGDTDADTDTGSTVDSGTDSGVPDTGVVDSGVEPVFCCADVDLDGFGNAKSCEFEASGACSAGYVLDTNDCNDSDALVNPDAAEVCDSANVDENCNGLADDADTLATGKTSFFTDADLDLYGANYAGEYCDVAPGISSENTDCDDSRNDVFPGASEYCDDVDNNCDGSVDDSAIDQTMWSRDVDLDGYGGTSASTVSCDAPAGYVANASDCNDAVDTIYPGAVETGNGIDDDCDGVVDDGVTCIVDIQVFTEDSGKATSIVESVADDATLDGDWILGIAGVAVVETSLGGDDWEYEATLDLCLSSTIELDATFANGSTFCDAGEVYAWEDGTALIVMPSSGCSLVVRE